MNLCSEKHDEVCYDAKRCPACEVIEELQGRLADLETELEAAQKGKESV